MYIYLGNNYLMAGYGYFYTIFWQRWKTSVAGVCVSRHHALYGLALMAPPCLWLARSASWRATSVAWRRWPSSAAIRSSTAACSCSARTSPRWRARPATASPSSSPSASRRSRDAPSSSRWSHALGFMLRSYFEVLKSLSITLEHCWQLVDTSILFSFLHLLYWWCDRVVQSLPRYSA